MPKQKKIRMIGLDLDGTFLDSNKDIPAENIDAVEEALRRGIHVLPVTGRPFSAIPEEIRTCVPWKYCIASGGATIHELPDGKKRSEILMSKETARGAMKALTERGFLLNLFVDGVGYVNAHELARSIENAPTEASREYIRRFRVPVPDIMEVLETADQGVEKLTASAGKGDAESLPGIGEAMEALAPYMEELCVMGNCEISIEIQSIYAQKGLAMIGLGKELGITREEMMAFGDSDNDLEMIERAGIGVAMANANAGVRKAADLVTKSNNENGVAYMIRKICFEETDKE